MTGEPICCGLRGWYQSRLDVTSPLPPAGTARAAPPYPASATTTPSAETTEAYSTLSPSGLTRPSHDQSSFPVAGSKPLTLPGTVRSNSSCPSTVATIGVLQDPI